MADFEWFRSFIAIYRQGTISSAAELRFMTQPALSQQLAALESEIGLTLFHRSPRRMIPTERGKLLYNQIVESVDRLEHANAEFHHNNVSPLLRIGGPSEFISERLLPNLPDTAYRISFTFGETKELLQALRNHDIDLLIASQQIASPGIVYNEFINEKFMLVGAASESAILDSDLSQIQAQLEHKEWIAYSSDLPIIRRFWHEAFGNRASIQPRYTVPDLKLIKMLVQQGKGISILPDYLVRNEISHDHLLELWAPPKYSTNQLWLAYRSSDKTNEAFNEWMLKLTLVTK